MKKIGGFIAVAMLVIFSYYFLDKPVALLVKDLWRSGSQFSFF